MFKYDTFSFTVWLGVHQSENCPVQFSQLQYMWNSSMDCTDGT